jgi:flagellar FliL protein
MSDESETAAATPAPAKKGMNPLVLVMIASLVTAATVGGGLYFALGSKVQHSAEDVDAEEEAAAEVAPVKKAAKGKASSKMAKKGPALYVKLDTPFVVNFEAKGIMRFLQITVELMTRDPQTVELLKMHEPMIRNNLLMLFGNQNFEKLNSMEGKEALRAEALKSIGESLKSEGGKANKIEQLYFTSFVMQ